MSAENEYEDSEQKKDIMDIHDAAYHREEILSEEGNERGPWWLYAIIIVVHAYGFFYIGFYWGDFSYEPHVLYSEPQPVQAQQAEVKELSLMERGENVYNRVCQTCHQADGQGTPGAFPPLSETDYVTGNPKRLTAIVLHGLMGEIKVAGSTYNGSMPAWGDQLSDKEVASVLTYIRASFGNNSSEVPVDTVKAVRKSIDRSSQWTVEELNQAFNE